MFKSLLFVQISENICFQKISGILSIVTLSYFCHFLSLVSKKTGLVQFLVNQGPNFIMFTILTTFFGFGTTHFLTISDS